jgi:hypothetical protein
MLLICCGSCGSQNFEVVSYSSKKHKTPSLEEKKGLKMQVLCLSEMILPIFQTTAKNYIPQQSKTKPSNAIHAASDNYLSQSLSLLLEHDENEPNVLQKRGQAQVNMNLFKGEKSITIITI